jgi:hypothetical protein
MLSGALSAKKGGVLGMGHPVVYYNLNTIQKDHAVVCKWCGLKYMRKHPEKSIYGSVSK